MPQPEVGSRQASTVIVLDTIVPSELAKPDPDGSVLRWVAQQRLDARFAQNRTLARRVSERCARQLPLRASLKGVSRGELRGFGPSCHGMHERPFRKVSDLALSLAYDFEQIVRRPQGRPGRRRVRTPVRRGPGGGPTAARPGHPAASLRGLAAGTAGGGAAASRSGRRQMPSALLRFARASLSTPAQVL